MAKFNFNLREPSSQADTAIHLVVRWSNKRVVIHTCESINPKLWETDKEKNNFQRVKRVKQFPEYPEFNTRLDNIMSTAKNVFRKYVNDNEFEQPSVDTYRKLLNQALSNTSSSTKIDMISFINMFIDNAMASYKAREGNSRNNIAGTYKQTLSLLIDYSKFKKTKIDFDSIDLDFYYDLIKYMESKKNYSINTIGKHIKTLKTFLNEATEQGYNKKTAFKSKRFKVLQEDVDSIYLTKEEVFQLFSLDLSKRKGLEKARDLFIVGCWTGLRFSDFTKIHPENIKGEFIEIKTQKTGEIVIIPIHSTIKQIMQKYKDEYYNSLPPSISNVKMNVYLKEIGSMIDPLKNKVTKTITKGGVKRTVTLEKYELLTTHTARRSFATNQYILGVPSLTIMKITGHRTERSFLKYIKITPNENAKILQLHWQKENKLKII